jgi:Glycosyl transferase family 2
VKLSCVILTMGDRPADLQRAIDSVLAQSGPPVELVVVGNGCDVPGLPAGVKTVLLPRNVGVAAGRNHGVDACAGDVVLFLDDDGWFPDTGLAVYLADKFGADPALAVVSMRVVDPDGGPGARWHVPRLRAGDPGRSSAVTVFLGGASAIRVPGGRRLPGVVLLRPRGDRPSLAAAGPRLPAGVRRHRPDVPPRHAERPLRHVPPPRRPQPRPAGPP